MTTNVVDTTMNMFVPCTFGIRVDVYKLNRSGIRTTSSVHFRQQYVLGHGYYCYARSVSFECHEIHGFSSWHKELLSLHIFFLTNAIKTSLEVKNLHQRTNDSFTCNMLCSKNVLSSLPPYHCT